MTSQVSYLPPIIFFEFFYFHFHVQASPNTGSRLPRDFSPTNASLSNRQQQDSPEGASGSSPVPSGTSGQAGGGGDVSWGTIVFNDRFQLPRAETPFSGESHSHYFHFFFLFIDLFSLSAVLCVVLCCVSVVLLLCCFTISNPF